MHDDCTHARASWSKPASPSRPEGYVRARNPDGRSLVGRCKGDRIGSAMVTNPTTRGDTMSRRADALADRLEQGAPALIPLAAGLSDEEWLVRIPGDGRTVGVIVHHVGNMYPIEIE